MSFQTKNNLISEVDTKNSFESINITDYRMIQNIEKDSQKNDFLQ